MNNKKSPSSDLQLNKLLQKQIVKILKKKDLNSPEMQSFLAAVNDTYTKFENEGAAAIKKRQPEKNLIDLDNLQQAILNSTDYAIIYTDTSGLIRSFNIGAEKMLGYKANEVVDHFSPAIFHDNLEILAKAEELSRELGETVKPGFDVIVARTKNGGIKTNEWTCIRKDWSRITIQLSLSAISDSENKIVGYLGIARDVTEQKKAQIALQLSEERYRGIVEKSTDIIYRADKAGNFTYVNPVAERVTGYTQAELSGKHFTELIKPDNREAAKIFYRNQLEEAKRTTYYEFPVISKTGNEVWIGQSVQLSEGSDGQTEFTALAIDITERRNYERGIFLQNEKYRNIISNMNLGLLEVDLAEKVKFVNHAFTVLSGFSEAEILGKTASELFFACFAS